MGEVHFVGRIVGGEEFDTSSLFCKWLVCKWVFFSIRSADFSKVNSAQEVILFRSYLSAVLNLDFSIWCCSAGKSLRTKVELM
jgi:hypothetical protein